MRTAHYTKIRDAGVRRRGLWNSLGSLRPTLRDDEQRGSPYDAKVNVAEIGAVNMGEKPSENAAAKKRALTTVARA